MRKGSHHTSETREKIRLDNLKNPRRYWLGKTRSDVTNAKISATKKGTMTNETHFAWKGDSASYRAKHIWVEARLGKPHRCDDCGDTTKAHRQYHWSNISGNYKRIITDWRRLCVKCHIAFDKGRVKTESH